MKPRSPWQADRFSSCAVREHTHQDLFMVHRRGLCHKSRATWSPSRRGKQISSVHAHIQQDMLVRRRKKLQRSHTQRNTYPRVLVRAWQNATSINKQMKKMMSQLFRPAWTGGHQAVDKRQAPGSIEAPPRMGPCAHLWARTPPATTQDHAGQQNLNLWICKNSKKNLIEYIKVFWWNKFNPLCGQTFSSCKGLQTRLCLFCSPSPLFKKKTWTFAIQGGSPDVRRDVVQKVRGAFCIYYRIWKHDGLLWILVMNFMWK